MDVISILDDALAIADAHLGAVGQGDDDEWGPNGDSKRSLSQ